MRLGFCLRQVGQLARAASAYAQAGRVAAAAGDLMGVLRSRLGDAKIALMRGNMPRATQILDDTAQRAADANLASVRSMALHDLSAIAYHAGNYERAVRLAYEALETSSNQRDRDRILADIATGLLQLGVRSAARDAYLVLASTAIDQYVRWTALINLLEIAALDGREVIFEQYRRELADQPLSVEHRVDYQIAVGDGYALLGHVEQAKYWLEMAIETASRVPLNQMVFKAEEKLQRLVSAAHSRPAAPREDAVVGEEVESIAGAIRGMRLTAGVTG
jgi:tetratricopeptide (TPR) repeat protein